MPKIRALIIWPSKTSKVIEFGRGEEDKKASIRLIFFNPQHLPGSDLISKVSHLMGDKIDTFDILVIGVQRAWIALTLKNLNVKKERVYWALIGNKALGSMGQFLVGNGYNISQINRVSDWASDQVAINLAINLEHTGRVNLHEPLAEHKKAYEKRNSVPQEPVYVSVHNTIN